MRFLRIFFPFFLLRCRRLLRTVYSSPAHYICKKMRLCGSKGYKKERRRRRREKRELHIHGAVGMFRIQTTICTTFQYNSVIWRWAESFFLSSSPSSSSSSFFFFVLFCLSNTNEIYGLRWMLSSFKSRELVQISFSVFFSDFSLPVSFFFSPALALISCSHRNEWIMLSVGRRIFRYIYIFRYLFICCVAVVLCLYRVQRTKGILFSHRGVIQHLGSLSSSSFVLLLW